MASRFALCRRVPAGCGNLKYSEGMSAALVEMRRAIRRLPDSPDVDTREVLRDIRERWAAQSSAPGRAGGAWADYLAGGVHAVERVLAKCPSRPRGLHGFPADAARGSDPIQS